MISHCGLSCWREHPLIFSKKWWNVFAQTTPKHKQQTVFVMVGCPAEGNAHEFTPQSGRIHSQRRLPSTMGTVASGQTKISPVFLFLRPFPLSRFSVFATFLFRSPPLSASIMLRLSFLPLLVSLSVSFPLLSLPGSLVFLPPTSACTAPKAQSPRSDNAQNNYKTIIKQL